MQSLAYEGKQIPADMVRSCLDDVEHTITKIKTYLDDQKDTAKEEDAAETW
jgi:hypothetical protein